MQLALRIAIAFDVKRAEKNEEFMASVSRTAIVDQEVHLLSDIIDHARQRATYLTAMYNELRMCYAEQDGILSIYIYSYNRRFFLNNYNEYFSICYVGQLFVCCRAAIRYAFGCFAIDS